MKPPASNAEACRKEESQEHRRKGLLNENIKPKPRKRHRGHACITMTATSPCRGKFHNSSCQNFSASTLSHIYRGEEERHIVAMYGAYLRHGVRQRHSDAIGISQYLDFHGVKEHGNAIACQHEVPMTGIRPSTPYRASSFDDNIEPCPLYTLHMK